ncbi:MAG: tetratricopeptide repeat protein, partial [Nannocystaceae bacterium]
GLVYARQERYAKAVDSLKRAIRMDRFDHQAHITLGLLYKRKFAGGEDEQAIEHLEKALELRPDLPQLRLFLGELYARSNRELARRHYKQFIESVPRTHRDYERAREALNELNYSLSEVVPEIVLDPPTNLRRLDPTLQRMINEAYLRAGDNGDWAKAERILNQALEEFPDEVVVHNELAKVAFADQRPGDARRFWEQSLELQEDQMEVHERLGILLERELPTEALPHLRRASELGSATGQYLLAELLWEQYRLVEASDVIDLYLAQASDYELNWERARRLRAEMDRFFLKVYIGVGLLLAFALAIPAMWIFRRLRGASLSQLLERAPTAFPEVARILSLIRHEILKHNTAFLADVGRALELDEADAETRVAIVQRRLFGDRKKSRRSRRSRRKALRVDQDRSTRDQGIYGRFLGYIEELQNVARSHGVTLNLYQKDPIFRSMIRAFEDLWVLGDLPR